MLTILRRIISISEDNQILEPMMDKFYSVTTEYFELNLSNAKIGHRIFAFGLSAFLYVLALENIMDVPLSTRKRP